MTEAKIKIDIIKDVKLPSLDEMVDELKLPECGAVAIFQGIKLSYF